jgi:hypothetical protein
LLFKLLNEGELMIKWDRKIKNKGNAVRMVELRSSLVSKNLCHKDSLGRIKTFRSEFFTESAGCTKCCRKKPGF